MNLEKASFEDVKLLPYDIGKSSIPDVSNRAFFIMNKIIYEDCNANRDVIGNDDRFVTSKITGLIVYKNIDVGFIYATVEHRYEAALFLDMAILPEYRNMKIGGIAMEKLIHYFGNKVMLIAETKKKNDATKNMGPKHGAIIPINNANFDYYVFPKSRLQEIDINIFEEAMSKPEKNGRQIKKSLQ